MQDTAFFLKKDTFLKELPDFHKAISSDYYFVKLLLKKILN